MRRVYALCETTTETLDRYQCEHKCEAHVNVLTHAHRRLNGEYGQDDRLNDRGQTE